jgi:uncharacterized protein (TIGR02217 family)
MAFLDIEFPRNISYGSEGGPEYSTSVITTQGGAEQRNINWTYPRMKYNVAYGVRHERDLEEVLYFFHLANGRANTFRYYDWSDHKTSAYDDEPTSQDCFIGTNAGTTTTLQLYKTYTISNITYSRKIVLPIQGTLLVARYNGGIWYSMAEGVNYSVNYTTGVITLLQPAVDTGSIYAGFQFNVKVRFDSDVMSVRFDAYTAASTEINLVEIK